MLLVLFLIPFVSALIAFSSSRLSVCAQRALAIILSLIPLGLLLSFSFMDTEIRVPWLTAIALQFHLAVDGVTLLFLYLTAIVIPVSLLATRWDQLVKPAVYAGLVLLLQGLLIGFFTARDLALFTILWEAMLLPLYFLMSVWGGARRESAAFKFLIYMLAGSALMIAAVLGLYFYAAQETGSGTFNFNVLAGLAGQSNIVNWLFFAFVLAFAVKTPLFPFHGWLPESYYQASTGGTILLSAILSKAGIYGFYRIGLGFFPDQMQAWSPWLLGLAIVGVLYAGLAAWAQSDFKRLIAYSSLSHVNFILAGIFVWNATSHGGAILQAFNHGITVAALFWVAGWLEERLGTTSINFGSGFAKFLPVLAWITLFFVLSAVALPGLNTFVGEFLILFGLFGYDYWLAFWLGLSIILSAVYMLRWMQKIYFGAPSFHQDRWVDIRAKEIAMVVPLMAIVLWVGIYPAPIFDKIMPEIASISSDKGPAS